MEMTSKLPSQRFVGVKWFLDGELLKHVEKDPSCIDGSLFGAHCNVDPSKIILVNVRRSFHGNYSCSGRNRAGWGQQSPSKELKVLYEPSVAKIRHEPSTILKGKQFDVSLILI